MAKNQTAPKVDVSRPSKESSEGVWSRIKTNTVTYSREDLRRDTYLPAPGSHGFPRGVRAANCRDQ
jgi:hypothetical protein